MHSTAENKQIGHVFPFFSRKNFLSLSLFGWIRVLHSLVPEVVEEACEEVPERGRVARPERLELREVVLAARRVEVRVDGPPVLAGVRMQCSACLRDLTS